MTANAALVKERGISEENVALINSLHDQLDYLIENADCSEDRSVTAELVRQAEFTLQTLWGFTRDSRYFTWCVRLHKRFRELDYIGVVYRCKETGVTRTVQREDLMRPYLFGVGNGFIDFGDVVRRVGPIERVK